MRPRILSLLAPLVLAAGCSSPQAPVPPAAPVIPAEVQALENAWAFLRQGNPEDAMLELDTALEIDGEEPRAEVHFLRGVAALRMGAKAGNAFFFEDARRSFLSAAPLRPAAWFGAARATWMQYYQTSNPEDLAQALKLVRTGFAKRGAHGSDEAFFQESPYRTRGEIAFDAYTKAKDETLPADKLAALFDEALDAFEAEIGRDTTNPWGWGRLSNLYEWGERAADARTTILSAVDLIPDDINLHNTLVRLAKAEGGWSEVIQIYKPFVASHEANALGHWYLGKANYEFGLNSMLADRKDRSKQFRIAIAHLSRCRELEPSYTDACKGFEIISRNGLGWSHFYAGRLTAASNAWWSMEEFAEGGLQWEVKGRLFSGVVSLPFAVAAHNTEWEKGRDSNTPEGYREGFPHLQRATDLAVRIFEYSPKHWGHANDAGYFSRDLAVELEAQAQAAYERGSDNVDALLSSSNEHMERSLIAYEMASRMAPEDARTVNDTGLILAYYLQRDLDRSEVFFKEALRVGITRLKIGIIDPEEKDGVTSAVGDAYQNLGVLELTLRGNAKNAKAYFEQSLSYEVAKRVDITSYYLPLCNKVLAGEIAPELIIEAHAWGKLTQRSIGVSQAAKARLEKQLAGN